MDTVNLIYDYFPELTEEQRERFARLEGLYREWNEKINVISRKDMDEFWVHHVLHSLAIAKIIRFAFDNDETARINQMWINVRCFNIHNVPAIVYRHYTSG